MIRVVIESPFGSRVDGSRASHEEVTRNIAYARRAMLDSLLRGEAPFLSHLLYPQALVDSLPAQRRMGMEAGFAWGRQAQGLAVYADYGLTPGMHEGVSRSGLLPVARYIGRSE